MEGDIKPLSYFKDFFSLLYFSLDFCPESQYDYRNGNEIHLEGWNTHLLRSYSDGYNGCIANQVTLLSAKAFEEKEVIKLFVSMEKGIEHNQVIFIWNLTSFFCPQTLLTLTSGPK